MDISPQLARHVIEVLGSSGTPPSRGVHLFNTGNALLLEALDDYYLKTYLAEGGASFKLVVGDYGSGKTHFLYCLRNLAWERGFAVAKVELSPTETPYNDQKAVYAAVARLLIWHTVDGISDEHGLPRFLQGCLEQICDRAISPELRDNPLYIGLKETLEFSSVEAPAFKAAVIAYFEALIQEQDDLGEALERWLLAEATTPEDSRLLRSVGVTGKISRSNAFRMLRSLVQVVRLLSFNGLILLFDEVDRMSSVGAKAERVATDNLREVIDRCREDLAGAMFVYAVPPQFLLDVVPRYPALQQRLRSPGRFSRANHLSPHISLEQLDMAEDDLLCGIGEKLLPVFEAAYQVSFDPNIQKTNIAILANVARDIILDVSHRRLFIKAFVGLLLRQQQGEELITEEGAQGLLRNEAVALSSQESAPY